MGTSQSFRTFEAFSCFIFGPGLAAALNNCVTPCLWIL